MEGGQRRATMGVGGVAGVLGLVNIPSKQKPPHIQHTVDTRAANASLVFTITEKTQRNYHKGRDGPLRTNANQTACLFMLATQFFVHCLFTVGLTPV